MSQPAVFPLTQDLYRIGLNHKLERARDGECLFIVVVLPPYETQ